LQSVKHEYTLPILSLSYDYDSWWNIMSNHGQRHSGMESNFVTQRDQTPGNVTTNKKESDKIQQIQNYSVWEGKSVYAGMVEFSSNIITYS